MERDGPKLTKSVHVFLFIAVDFQLDPLQSLTGGYEAAERAADEAREKWHHTEPAVFTTDRGRSVHGELKRKLGFAFSAKEHSIKQNTFD